MVDGITLLSTTSLANILGMDRSYVVRLSDQGILPKRDDGKFDAVETLGNYCRYLRAKLNGRENNPRDELLRLKTVDLEIKIEERLKHLIPINQAMDTVDILCGMFVSRLNGMPAAMTRDVKLRLKFEDFVDSLLNDLADECDRAAKALASGIDIFEEGFTEEFESDNPSKSKTTCQNPSKNGSRGPYRKGLMRLKRETQ